mmetsp:Transcript_24038/g.44238  ORF Transcript_24038/g.44238 Transcript_24038/m.44238 type:complete len:263 (-) Transcript_24038:1064-1852(-)
MRLCHFHADGPAADDQQVIGAFAQIPQAFVGQVGHRINTLDRRDKGAGPCGDYNAPGRDDRVASLHLFVRNEVPKFTDHLNTKPLEPFLAVHRLNLCNYITHVVLGCGVVDLRHRISHAVDGGMGLAIGHLAAGNQRLGGHAAVVQAITAHLVPFEQDNLCPHLAGPGGHRQAARSGANHQNIGLDPFHFIQRPFLPRTAFSTMGSAARTHRPRIGRIICGSKIMPRFGVSPLSKTSPKPAPTDVKTTAPGIIPRKVVIAKR